MTTLIPRVSHVEWLVSDLERAVAFLEGLFGWQFKVYSRHYRLYTPPDGTSTCVGLMEVATVNTGSSPMVHIQVPAIAPYLARGVTLGGRIKAPRTAIPDYGFYAQLLDPDGNIVGLFEAAGSSSSAT